ncbi:MAG: PAS domain S-box protein [Methyloprofundus sp.]|nr:PAS domain S-box protein [Methyloprofundus sp.]
MNFLRPSPSLLSVNWRLFIVSTLLLGLFGGISLFFTHHYHLDKEQLQHFQKQKILLEERIDKKVKILHAATLVLANNSIIRQELVLENREAMISEIGHLREQFAYWTGFVNYAFHVATFDGRSLYQNYDPANYGQDISQHPLMQKAMADTSQAVTLIAKGGYGNTYRIINSQPVFALDNPEQLAGFMTVSQGLKQIVVEFEQDGLEYYVFEREPNSQELTKKQFVVDSAPYFSDRPFSNWVFNESELNHQQLQLRDGWYYQTHPIYDHQNQLQAFHLILVPKQQINHQAWLQTQQVFWVVLLAFLLVFFGGLIQLGLLRNNVLKPMRRLTGTLKTIIKTERYDQVVEVGRNDEIGRVTQLFNQMLARTDKLIFDLKYQKLAIDQTLIISRADKFGTITEVNDNFCQISGYPKDELIGRPHSIVRHPDMDSAIFKEMWHTIQSKQIWQGEVQNRRKDGSSYFVKSYIIPILNRQDEIQEYLSIREDITLIVELREGMQKALVQAEQDKHLAEQANKAKSEFLASMSHELRTPLNAIIGYAQLLELAKLEPKSLKQLNTILASSKHLLALINDILDFAKLESGKVQFNFETLQVKDLVFESIQLTQTQAKQQGITVEVASLSPDLSIQVDRLRFKQVLLNLLSNAIKYNKPQGKIFVSCQQAEKDQQVYWQLSIQDSGVGITSDDLNKLFQPFNRLGHEGSSIQGTGIGLSITKDLVEQMHGWIEVESVQGEGTTFSLFFPVVNMSAANKAATPGVNENAIIHDAKSAGFKVLYIGHDSTVMLALVQATADLEQVELKIAPSAQNGLEQIQQFNPGLVLMDEALSERDQLATEIEQYGLQIQTISQQDLNRLQEMIGVYLNKS